MTSIIVSHDIEEVLSIADHVIIIADKGIAAEGSPDDVREHKSPFIQQFLKGEADGPLAFQGDKSSYSSSMPAGVVVHPEAIKAGDSSNVLLMNLE